MATTSERTSSAVIEQLRTAPYRFDFFQAVRLLQRYAREERLRVGMSLAEVGHEGPSRHEALRFRAHPSHTFPSGAVQGIRFPAEGDRAEDSHPCELVLAFFGLTGPVGALPHHYTQLMIDRVRRKDFSMRDFFDLFNHRTASLFYRAWEKYRLPIHMEQALLRGNPGDDLFSRSLFCFVGLGSGAATAGDSTMRRRMAIPDEVLVYYGGFFAHRPRNAVSLELLVQDYWRLPTRIVQFRGQWLRLAREDQTQMPARLGSQTTNTRLGLETIVGERIWSVEHRFCIRLGPLGYNDFRRFTPQGAELIPLGQLVRTYVGPEFDFEVQPVLLAKEVPDCRLGGPASEGSRLGWNTWLQSRPRESDAEDAVFSVEGLPV